MRALLSFRHLLLLCSLSLLGPTLSTPTVQAAVSTEEAVAIATEAYVYGYSLITTEVTRVQMSNVPAAVGYQAPMNQFINVKRYPPADYRGVSAPNADTLYSLAWLDLSEPLVFSHPDMGKRFYLFELVDLWMTAFETPGTRTAGGGCGELFAHWTGLEGRRAGRDEAYSGGDALHGDFGADVRRRDRG